MRDPPFKIFCHLGDPSIVFKEEEVEHLNLDHDDALVVSLRIVNALMKRIHMDKKNSIDILYYNVFLKIGLSV